MDDLPSLLSMADRMLWITALVGYEVGVLRTRRAARAESPGGSSGLSEAAEEPGRTGAS